MTNSTPPPTINTSVVLAVLFGTVALLMGLGVILYIAIPNQAGVAWAGIAVIVAPVILTLTKLLQVGEQLTTVGKQVDGQTKALVEATTATGIDKATIAGLQATLAAIQGQQQALLDAAAASNTTTRTETVTTLESPSTVTPAAVAAAVTVVGTEPPAEPPADPPATGQPATYQSGGDNYPDGPTPFGPPPSPRTEKPE